MVQAVRDALASLCELLQQQPRGVLELSVLPQELQEVVVTAMPTVWMPRLAWAAVVSGSRLGGVVDGPIELATS